ncbi:MAG: DUF4124 domain-containing protein [Bdellovibrionota bacterium]
MNLPAFADEVYKWIDEHGVAHYTSTPPTADAKPAELPEISRGDVEISKKLLKTCKKHGGIDCDAGADADGSVICYDGFKDAAARYTMSCSSPKLEVSDVSEIQNDGSFSVFIRNSRSVAAEGMKVYFKPDNEEYKLLGPDRVDAFGVAEYFWKDDPGIPLLDQPKSNQIRIACDNCDV